VTNLARPAERAVAFSNQRSTAEQRIREGFLLQFAVPRSLPTLACLPIASWMSRLQLTDTGADNWRARTGKNGRHRLAGLLRQSVFGRLAGYEGRERRQEAVPRPGDAPAGRRPGNCRNRAAERPCPFHPLGLPFAPRPSLGRSPTRY